MQFMINRTTLSNFVVNLDTHAMMSVNTNYTTETFKEGERIQHL